MTNRKGVRSVVMPSPDLSISGKNNLVHSNKARIFGSNLMIIISAVYTKGFYPERFIFVRSHFFENVSL